MSLITGVVNSSIVQVTQYSKSCFVTPQKQMAVKDRLTYKGWEKTGKKTTHL